MFLDKYNLSETTGVTGWGQVVGIPKENLDILFINS